MLNKLWYNLWRIDTFSSQHWSPLDRDSEVTILYVIGRGRTVNYGSMVPNYDVSAMCRTRVDSRHSNQVNRHSTPCTSVLKVSHFGRVVWMTLKCVYAGGSKWSHTGCGWLPIYAGKGRNQPQEMTVARFEGKEICRETYLHENTRTKLIVMPQLKHVCTVAVRHWTGRRQW